jgi:hypothetical protein
MQLILHSIFKIRIDRVGLGNGCILCGISPDERDRSASEPKVANAALDGFRLGRQFSLLSELAN